MWDSFIFGVGMITAAGLLFTSVYYLISYSDLEADYVNPIELCSKLNALVLPEYMAHLALTSVFLLSFNFRAVLWNAPLVAWHYARYSERRHWHDPTEIYRKVREHKQEAFVKLAFFLLSFGYYMYRMTWALVDSSL